MEFLLRQIETVITTYAGEIPLSLFLKSYFKQHPKLGSRDRKAISEAAFLFYRVRNFLPEELPILSVIKAGLAVSSSENEFLKNLFLTVDEENRNTILLKWDKTIQFSEGITEKAWLESLLVQPSLFFRILKNKEKNLQFLRNAGVDFQVLPVKQKVSFEIVSAPNGSKIDKVLPPEDYVIQDYTSQTIIGQAACFRTQFTGDAKIWDVCAGAGGKSIFWKSFFPEDALLATDIRKSILHNLKERFKRYELRKFDTIHLDISKAKNLKAIKNTFGFILCDVPCSGSGTWGRTPEQFYFFKKEKLKNFSALQSRIALNATSKLQPDGVFIYMTCSVFEEENEAIVRKLCAEKGLAIDFQQLFNGISQKADSLFLAVLRKQ